MGAVTSAVLELVRAQVGQRGLVLWHDPERQYTELLPTLRSSGIAVEEYDGSFFALRRRVETALANDGPGRLVVYVALPEEETRYTLAELHASAAVLRPGSAALNRNTRLGTIARQALAGRIPEPELESIVEKANAGVFRLADLDDVAEQPGSAIDGALRLVYGEDTPAETLLAFVTDPSRDEALREKKAVEAVAAVAAAFGLPARTSGSVEELRSEVVRHVLAAELAAHLPADVMPHLPRPSEAAREGCVHLARSWRRRSDLRESYVAASHAAAAALRPTADGIPFETLARVETFETFEHELQRACEERLRVGEVEAVLRVADERVRGFWASVDGTVLSRWSIIATAARLYATAEEIDDELGQTHDVAALAGAYTRPEKPWSDLDSLHRRLERFVHLFDFSTDGHHAELEQLVAAVRERHARVSTAVAERFVDALVAEGSSSRSVPSQTEAYERLVKPALADGAVAYVLVDALRYEMARELSDALARHGSARLQPLMGTLPSITEIGMAALMPRAHVAPALAQTADGALALSVESRPLRTRKERLEYLVERADVPVFATTLDVLLSAKPKTRQGIRDARLVVVTATEELDGLCESGNVGMARRLMDDVLSQLARATRLLHDLGIKTVVITADHGFLFGESVEAAGRIDPPGGQTVGLHRRAWIGRGGANSPSCARFTARQLGLGGDLDVVVPRALGCFKTPGVALAYFHGGASPQELLVPGLVIRASTEAAHRGNVEWTITPGSKALSSRFASVEVAGAGAGLFKLTATPILVEVREGNKRLSRAVAASYGFEEATGSATMDPDQDARSFRRNTITLEIQTKPTGQSVAIVLVDPVTDRVLKSLDVSVRLAGF